MYNVVPRIMVKLWLVQIGFFIRFIVFKLVLIWNPYSVLLLFMRLITHAFFCKDILKKTPEEANIDKGSLCVVDVGKNKVGAKGLF